MNDVSYEIGKWLHLGYIYKDGILMSYKDGVLVSTKTWVSGSGWDTGSGPFEDVHFGWFGYYRSDIHIDLDLDEVYVWERDIRLSLLQNVYLVGL